MLQVIIGYNYSETNLAYIAMYKCFSFIHLFFAIFVLCFIPSFIPPTNTLLVRSVGKAMQIKMAERGSSHLGSVVTNLTSIREDVGLIPDLNQWVKGLVLP